MADSSIALQVKTPNSLQSISGVMDIAGKAQQFQAHNIELQKQRIILGERKNIQSLFQNPQSFTDANGQMDYEKLISEGMKVAPTTFPTMVPQIIQAHKSSLDAKAALNTLTSEQRNQVGQFVMSLNGDDPATARNKLMGLVETNPQLAPAVDFAWKYSLEPASKQTPEVWRNAILRVGQSAMAPAAQVTAMTPTGPQVTNNVQTGTMNLGPLAGPTGIVPGTVIDQQLPLAERQRVEMNPVTQSPQTVAKDAFGNVQGVTQTPVGPGVPQLAPGQVQDLPIITQERAKLNDAASQVPTQRFNNAQIIKLTTEPTLFSLTGPTASFWTRIASVPGVPTFGQDNAKNFQALTHYLAMQTQANANAMGANTDSSREISKAISGSTEMTPEALRNIAKVNDAFATGVLKFNQGMEQAIKNAGGNVLAAREFKNEWARHFDPDVYRYANALEAKDTAEVNAILGKPNSPERAKKARELAVKAQKLYQLSGQ